MLPKLGQVLELGCMAGAQGGNQVSILGSTLGILRRVTCREGIYTGECKYNGHIWNIYIGVLGSEAALNALGSFQNIRNCN
jgi:hypothetical protein